MAEEQSRLQAVSRNLGSPALPFLKEVVEPSIHPGLTEHLISREVMLNMSDADEKRPGENEGAPAPLLESAPPPAVLSPEEEDNGSGFDDVVESSWETDSNPPFSASLWTPEAEEKPPSSAPGTASPPEETEDPLYPPFDPVAAFLSTQSVSGSPRSEAVSPALAHPSNELSRIAAPGAEEPGDLIHEEPSDSAVMEEAHEAEFPEEEAESPAHTPAAYRRHPLIRAFTFFCWVLLVVALGAAGVGVAYYRYAAERLYQSDAQLTGSANVLVERGDSYRRIVSRLKEAGLLHSYMGVDDVYLMRYLAWVNGDASKIRHGAYQFSTGDSLSEIYARLLKGAPESLVVVPEGLTVREMADLISRKHETFNPQRFVELTADQKFITSLGMYVTSLEGYLLPSGYSYGPGMKEEDLIRQMVDAFRKKAEEALRHLPKRDELSFHEHVIMASLVEEEARVDEDRPLIASVIHNRLKKGMKLQIDATVNYALNEWRRLTHSDYKVESPFNTYQIQGLPPAPICNPRISSLVATFTAPETDFLFYVHKGDGHHAFSKTYEEHLKNVKQYIKGAPRESASADSSRN